MTHAKPITLLLIAVALWVVLVSAGPTLVSLLEAAVPLVIAVGIVTILLRLVLFHTRKW